MSKAPHSISDHRFGTEYDHDHGPGGFDHDHDHDFIDGAGSADPVELISLGVDIGSSSTQLAFSRLTMSAGERRRQLVYLSPIAPTPYEMDGEIDELRLRRLVDGAFESAGLKPDDVETGVVILTGEAASRTNAVAIAHLLADDVGDLVCAAGGHHMEAMLSAQGSGAISASREQGGRRILLIDVGGATSKFALIDNGEVLGTAVIAAGGRLLVIDRENRITRLDPMGVGYVEAAGLPWGLGTVIDPTLRAIFAEAMATAITAVAEGFSSRSDIAPLLLTEPLIELGRVEGIMFAGGVGEYVYARETRDFGDLGQALGLALRRRFDAGVLPFPLLPPGEVIRATVLGASQHSLQMSGHTIFISDHAELLPCRNIPVLRPSVNLAQEILCAEDIAAAIEWHVTAFDLDDAAGRLALAFAWSGAPTYERLRAMCEGIKLGLRRRMARATPFYVLIDGDLALSLGRILKEELAVPSALLVADGIAAADFDFVDIGRVRLPSYTVPVTVKSLLFGGRQ